MSEEEWRLLTLIVSLPVVVIYGRIFVFVAFGV